MTAYNTGSGETYSDIAGAITGILADLTAGDLSTGGGGFRDIILSKETFAEGVDLTGFNNPSSANKVRIFAKAGFECGMKRGNGPIIDSTGLSKKAMLIQTSHTEIHDIEIIGIAGGSNRAVSCIGGMTNILLKNLIGINGNGSGVFSLIGTRVESCVTLATGTAKGIVSENAGDSVDIYNSICKGGACGIAVFGSGTMNSYNNAVYDTSVDDFSGTMGGTNNLSDDATAPGANSLINQDIADAKFINNISDWNIQSASNLRGVGIDKSSIFTTDPNGDIIDPSDWMIGPDFFVSTGGAGFGIGEKFRIGI